MIMSWRHGLSLAAKAELIAGAGWARAVKVDLDHLFALNGAARFVGEPREDGPCFDVDDLARGRVRKTTIEAERHPPRLVANGY